MDRTTEKVNLMKFQSVLLWWLSMGEVLFGYNAISIYLNTKRLISTIFIMAELMMSKPRKISNKRKIIDYIYMV
jgi:hypothetical protein